MKKKGMSTGLIIELVILILCFIAILFFLYGSNPKQLTDKQICANSVAMKAKTPVGGSVVTLDCTTEYVCISEGGKCSGINPTETIKVHSGNKQEIMKTIADKMSSCWWMFGEGKLIYIDTKTLKGSQCAICSVIKFDDSFLTEENKITYKEFYEYLNNTKKDETQSYLTYLYGENDLSSLLSNSGYKTLKDSYDSKEISFGDRYMVITGQGKIGFDNKIIRLIIGDPYWYNIAPHFFNAAEGTGDVQCGEYITKA